MMDLSEIYGRKGMKMINTMKVLKCKNLDEAHALVLLLSSPDTAVIENALNMLSPETLDYWTKSLNPRFNLAIENVIGAVRDRIQDQNFANESTAKAIVMRAIRFEARKHPNESPQELAKHVIASLASDLSSAPAPVVNNLTPVVAVMAANRLPKPETLEEEVRKDAGALEAKAEDTPKDEKAKDFAKDVAPEPVETAADVVGTLATVAVVAAVVAPRPVAMATALTTAEVMDAPKPSRRADKKLVRKAKTSKVFIPEFVMAPVPAYARKEKEHRAKRAFGLNGLKIQMAKSTMGSMAPRHGLARGLTLALA